MVVNLFWRGKMWMLELSSLGQFTALEFQVMSSPNSVRHNVG
jgi:hypothetical protein